MGIIIVVFMLVVGVILVFGGELIGINFDLLFYGVIVVGIVVFVVMFLVWNILKIKFVDM